MKLNLKVYEFSVLIQQAIRGEHQAALQVFMSPGEPSYIMQVCLTPDQVLSKSTGYNDAEFNRTLAAAFAETEQAKLKDLYGKLQTLAARDAPLGVLGYVHAPICGAEPPEREGQSGADHRARRDQALIGRIHVASRRGRILSSIGTLLFVGLALFALTRSGPGSPARIVLGADATSAQVAEFERTNGLDRPFLSRNTAPGSRTSCAGISAAPS